MARTPSGRPRGRPARIRDVDVDVPADVQAEIAAAISAADEPPPPPPAEEPEAATYALSIGTLHRGIEAHDLALILDRILPRGVNDFATDTEFAAMTPNLRQHYRRI